MRIKYRTLKAHNARDPKKDKQFTNRVILHREDKKCSLDGCNSPLTIYKGPGSHKLCREHQIKLKAYGGHARIDRPYTFWKKDHCEECGHSPMKDNKVIKKIPVPYRNILGMMMLHVDHIKVSKDDKYTSRNGANNPKNLRTLCQECHMLKTYSSGDHWVKGFHDKKRS